MPGYVIGNTLKLGFAGTISRTVDAIVRPFINKNASAAIEFGQPVALKSDGTGVISWGSSMTNADFYGVAVREVKTETSYGQADAKYLAGETVDVLTRGSIIVKCVKDTTATSEPVAGGKVYIRKATGVFVAASESTATVELTNAVWSQNGLDADGMAEIILTTRKI